MIDPKDYSTRREIDNINRNLKELETKLRELDEIKRKIENLNMKSKQLISDITRSLNNLFR